MISEKAQYQAEKCRFCWMCRHLCPVGLVTGREVNTPRAKALLLSMVKRGEPFTPEMAQVMYECVLCDACTNDCATGYEPPVFIREARTQAVAQDMAPKGVEALIEKIAKSGTIYGTEKPSFGTGDPKAELLVYLGETAACRVPQMVKAYLSLLDKAGVRYKLLAQEPASGVMLGDLEGYVEEVRQQAKRCADALNAAQVKTIVVLDSYDYAMMTQQYGAWGVSVDAKLQTATSYMEQLLPKLSIQKQSGVVTYHDDSRLARTVHEFEPARKIIEAMGFAFVEMFNHQRLAKSCGTSLAKAYLPAVVEEMAAARWNDLLRTEKAEMMITANPQAYEVLSMAVPSGKRLEDLFVLLNQAAR